MLLVTCSGLIALAIGGTSSSNTTRDCAKCAEWTLPQQPFKVYGNTYWVGTRTIGSVLITSQKGHILIDGTVQEGAPQVAAHIRALGLRVEDVRLILNTHVHYDHAGGIASLQQLSGAVVAASPWSARILMQGHDLRDDPLFDDHLRQPTPVRHVRIIRDGETLSVGNLSLVAHFTPGHTPGGTTWSWKSCEGSRCLNIVYADSLSALSAESFHFSHSTTYPNVLADFAKSFDVVRGMPCDVLLTNHPEFSQVMQRLEQRNAGHPDAFVSPTACRELADAGSAALEQRLTQERRNARLSK